MKKTTSLLLLCAIAFTAYSQSVGIGTSTPNASAQLDISSTGRGLLIPRMNSAAINAIPNPAKGLMVLDTAKNQLVFNVGTPAAPNWQSIAFSSGWSTTGNVNTNPAINFIGTTDYTSLVFKMNNSRSGLLSEYNTAFGYVSLGAASTGTGNTAIGTGAMLNNTQGNENTALGHMALNANLTGNNNTAIGKWALPNNKSGYSNVAVGYRSLYTTETGANLVAVGDSALYSNTTGTENTAIGSKALAANTEGTQHTALGFQALTSNTTSEGNTAIGFQSMLANTAGSYNTAIGFLSLGSNISGLINTALGYRALLYNETGNYNIAIGLDALRNNISGNENVAVGNDAGNATTGSNNVFLGNGAGAGETGSNKLYIGNSYDNRANPLVYGEFDNRLLQVNGKLKINVAAQAVGLDLGAAAIKVSGTNPAVFTVTATAAVLDLVIPNTSMANSSTDILIVTHRLSGTKLNSSPGVYWNGANWVIFLENFGNHIVGEQYNVLVIKQ